MYSISRPFSSVTKKYDVVTIGGGCVGCSIGRLLSKYDIKSLVVDKYNDVGMGTTKANSGIVHAGFHTELSLLKGKLVHHGNRAIRKLAKELHFGYRQIGELVVARDQQQITKVMNIARIANEKGISIEIWGQERLRKEEPNLSHDILLALYGPTGGVINPYEFAFALREIAEVNGCDFQLQTEVTGIDQKSGGGFLIHTNKGDIESKYVINAAGLFTDKIAKMIGDESFTIHPRKGEEYLLDKSFDDLFHHVIFPVGDKVSKGTLIIPTVDKTVMCGPTALNTDDRDDLTTSSGGVEKIFEFAEKNLSPLITQRGVIASFAGLRAASHTADFIIDVSEKNSQFINVAGIQSPGLTAAPAIGDYVLNILDKIWPELSGKQKKQWVTKLDDPLRLFARMSPIEQEIAVEKDANYGDVVCRCEFVTVGDIQSAIDHGADTMDGIKFRTRAGMGKCQGGFCSSRIMELLSYRMNVPLETISKFGEGSNILVPEWDDPRRSLKTQKAKLDHKFKKRELPDGKKLKRKLESKVYDVAIIGGGGAGLAAATSAKREGAENVIVFDREPVTGGILTQCIHSGFGLKYFGEELTGPEYAHKVGVEAVESGAEVYTNSYVYEMEHDEKTDIKKLRVLIGSELGGTIANIRAKTLILGMGCRERTRAAISIPGDRPAGVYTAGLAQKMINEMGVIPGKTAVILGSGDIGLIMARRLALEGCKVLGVFEILPNCSGLHRNVVQCLEDYNIPLKLSHTVVKIHGKKRLEKVTVAPVDPKTWKPIMEEAFDLECDTLLLSVGLIPENDLAETVGVEINPKTKGAKVSSEMMTNVPGIFSCGNVLHVHDIVDNVTEEGLKAGKSAILYLKDKHNFKPSNISIKSGKNVGYVVPERFSKDLQAFDRKKLPLTLSLRSQKIMSAAKFTVTDKVSGKKIVSRTIKTILPAEMIIFEIKGKQIKKLSELAQKNGGNVELEVSLEEMPEKKEKKTKKAKDSKTEGAQLSHITCVSCPEGCRLDVYHHGKKVVKVSGNKCPKGIEYGTQEFVDPRRVFSTTIAPKLDSTFKDIGVVPVKLSNPLPKGKLIEGSDAIHKVFIEKDVACGEVVAKNILGEEGVDLIVCREVKIEKLDM
ncbi:glycerol-3-phosphate dehydrogenase [Anaeramoeba flamelloides]|uniref:Glycerol-3-phosphate dehydrogenase n=1 Tax=Anaeramoeba flamelloides TaxID=1746091 RepID=A0ABQ8Z7I1_9EUKA|nr:glycerol-3-phosphate dehydrogenase [Anaeramoeba flamelloides]